MSTQDRLLSDEELRKSIEEIIVTDDYSHGVQMRTIDKMQKLIDTQKRLAVENVIEDLLGYGERGGDEVYKKTIGAEVVNRYLEQRARIK